MARTDNDTWDLASSVGATATMVAAARALASKEPAPLIDDPFADPLVRAVGVDFFVRLIDGDLEPTEVAEEHEFDAQRLVTTMAVRTRFFDDFFIDAANAGVHQAVILAAGLDARAYRLPWPAGTVVYEVDMPDVMEFKSRTLSGLGAQPTAERRVVPVDLRDDWPAALRASGFDHTAPAAWSAEGLLMYLPPDAQDRLFDSITGLSVAGSRLATEYHKDYGMVLNPPVQSMIRRWAQYGCDVDLSTLFYGGERRQVADYLTARDWQVSTRLRAELFEAAGQPMPDGVAGDALRNVVSVTAIRQ
jgi:methyltransferase (TIGR00027 family)